MAISDNFWFRTIPNVLKNTRGVPKYLIHFVTNRCNARCHHCFIDFDINVLTSFWLFEAILGIGNDSRYLIL